MIGQKSLKKSHLTGIELRREGNEMTLLENDVGAELKKVISGVSRDKNLDKAVIVDALEQAVIHAARRSLGATADLEAHYNEDTDEIELFQFRTVVEDDDVANDATEIALADAQKMDPESVLGDALGVKVDTAKFGRIAAQSAKQIIVQKVRDAERSQIYEEFKDPKRIVLIPEQNAKKQKYVISKCRFMLALRTHASIGAYSSYVPTLVTAYSKKAQGIAVDLLGTADDFIIPIASMKSKDRLVEGFRWLIDNEEKVKNLLNRRIPSYIQGAFSAKDEVSSLFFNK